MNTVQKLSGTSMSESVASNRLPINVMQPTERHIDEDAKSRMDDEGGSLEPQANAPETSGNKPIETKLRK